MDINMNISVDIRADLLSSCEQVPAIWTIDHNHVDRLVVACQWQVATLQKQSFEVQNGRSLVVNVSTGRRAW